MSRCFAHPTKESRVFFGKGQEEVILAPEVGVENRGTILDAIGDLSLAGAPLLCAYRSVRGGHSLNHAVLSALMADPSAWTVVETKEAPRRVVRGHADVAAGMVAPAYGPEIS